MTDFTVTLSALRKAGACYSGYNKVVRSLQGRGFSADDEDRESYIRFAHKEPISILAIIESNGLDDAIWALRCAKDADRDCRLYAVWCARQVQHLMTDQRSIDALNVAERHANGNSTDAARSAAWDAARSAASSSASSAARDAACAAASSAASSAAWAAASSAAGAAASSAGAAARDAARDAACAAQKQTLIAMCTGNAPWQNGGED